jgi:acyl-CoA hydrolase/GNAT superfamily N-acetyltransferase
MTMNTEYRQKLVDPQYALDLIKPGDRIFISSGPAIPALMVTELVKSSKPNLVDLEIIQLITLGDYFQTESKGRSTYRIKTFNIGESIRKDISEGKVDFVPANLLDIPLMVSTGAIGVDVAIIQTSMPDEHGFMSLGVAIDVANIAIKNASLVVAEVNPNVPHTYGETTIHISQIHHVVESTIPLIEREEKGYDSTTDRIGWHISNLIEDGSTVILHVGTLFSAVAEHLKTKRDLGIYTNVISDWVIDLISSGAISLNRNRFHGGLVTASFCYGTRALYDYVNRNPIFELYPIARLVNPAVIGRIPRLISIMNVKKMDVTGESVIFHSGDNFLTGYESKFNFAVGAAYAKRGTTIVALQSVDPAGESNIVVQFDKDTEKVRATLGVTRYVVTEYGIADLFGKSIRERVLALIEISHPSHREYLLEIAKTKGYVFPDQIYVKDNALNYPEHLETVKSFKDGLSLKFRPIRPTDEDMMRRLFYQFSDESKYLRYFAKLTKMPHREMQKYVNIDYDKTLSIVGLIEGYRSKKIVAEARYSYSPDDGSYEMAFIVDDDYHGKGVASFLLNYLIMIAKERGIDRLTASVLPENEKMLNVFKKSRAEVRIKSSNGIKEVTFLLGPTTSG